MSHSFTLIKIMIVVALVAILAAIAYPSYMDSMRRGWRAEARTALMQETQQQERVYTERVRYKTTAHKTFSGDNDAGSKYDIAVDPCDGRDDAAQCIR